MRIKALQLASNRAFHLRLGSLLASSFGASSASEALLAAAERRAVGRHEAVATATASNAIEKNRVDQRSVC
jgi:hypothetical protein